MLLQLCVVLSMAASVLPAPSPPPLGEPGVLLTFDDTHVAEWQKAIPLLKKYEAHATFFVTHFDQLTPVQVDGLRKLKEAGHAIGCHGLRHIKAVDHVKAHGIDDYLAREITPALAHMQDAGFMPTSFAYPMSNNDSTTDAALLGFFHHLRTGVGPKPGQRYTQMDALFTPLGTVATRSCLAGKGIDRIGEPGNEGLLEQLFEAMARAAKKREILVLYAHNIAATGKGHHLSPITLEKILVHGQRLGLRFYSFEELPWIKEE